MMNFNVKFGRVSLKQKWFKQHCKGLSVNSQPIMTIYCNRNFEQSKKKQISYSFLILTGYFMLSFYEK